MEEKYFNRYRSFCRSLRNLEKSKFADPTAEFVLGDYSELYTDI